MDDYNIGLDNKPIEHTPVLDYLNAIDTSPGRAVEPFSLDLENKSN